jgi:ribosomal protein S18 acetylase RimI-like enzyme
LITCREATNKDLEAVCVLGREVNAIHHAAWPDVFARSRDPLAAAILWAEAIGQPSATTFVAETAEAVVGFINIFFVERDKNPLLQPIPFARVGSVGVAQAYRGKGIGTELMRHAEAWATLRGARHLTLNVWAFNTRAAELYRELGYEVRSFSMGKRIGVNAN